MAFFHLRPSMEIRAYRWFERAFGPHSDIDFNDSISPIGGSVEFSMHTISPEPLKDSCLCDDEFVWLLVGSPEA